MPSAILITFSESKEKEGVGAWVVQMMLESSMGTVATFADLETLGPRLVAECAISLATALEDDIAIAIQINGPRKTAVSEALQKALSSRGAVISEDMLGEMSGGALSQMLREWGKKSH